MKNDTLDNLLKAEKSFKANMRKAVELEGIAGQRKVASENAVIETNQQFKDLHNRMDIQERKQDKSALFLRVTAIITIILATLAVIGTAIQIILSVGLR